MDEEDIDFCLTEEERAMIGNIQTLLEMNYFNQNMFNTTDQIQYS